MDRFLLQVQPAYLIGFKINHVIVPYSGKVSHGANFRAFLGSVGYSETKNSESFKLCVLCVVSEGAKIKTTKFSSGGDTGESVKVCTSENFPLYSN